MFKFSYYSNVIVAFKNQERLRLIFSYNEILYINSFLDIFEIKYFNFILCQYKYSYLWQNYNDNKPFLVYLTQ